MRGLVIQAKVLIGRNCDATGDAIAEAPNPKWCRYTGYKKFVNVISCAVKAVLVEVEIPPNEMPGHIGVAYSKYETSGLVLGTHGFTDDSGVARMLVGALKFRDHPCARAA